MNPHVSILVPFQGFVASFAMEFRFLPRINQKRKEKKAVRSCPAVIKIPEEGRIILVLFN